MATWMSYDDFTALIDCIFNISQLGCLLSTVFQIMMENGGTIREPPISVGSQKIMGGISRISG